VPRGGVVNARRPGRRPGRSEAKSIDDAEHGDSIIGAMVVQFNLAAELASVLPQNEVHARTDSCGRRRRILTVRSGCANGYAGDAILLHILGTQTATRDTTNDGVNDPVPVPSGQVQGTTPGSFTPSLVL
jgi:hypothetical protein